MGYAELLTEYINKAGISLRQIAKMCNEKGFSIDHSYISKLKNGKMPPPSEELSRVLAEVLNGDPDALVIEGYKEKAPNEIKRIFLTAPTGSGKTLASASRLIELMENQEPSQRPVSINRKYSMVIELADILEDEDIMVTAGGEPLGQDRKLNVLRALENPVSKTLKTPQIPILGVIRAGIPLLSEQNIIGKLDIPADLEGRVDFALHVRGDSMIGAGINENDIVCCKEDHEPQPGQIVVALINYDETTLKFFIKEKERGILRAANPKYADIELKPEDQIQGHVVKVIKDPPSINTYRNYIYFQEGHLQEWNQVIEEAVGYGVKPDQLRSMIQMQWEMLRKLVKGNI